MPMTSSCQIGRIGLCSSASPQRQMCMHRYLPVEGSDEPSVSLKMKPKAMPSRASASTTAKPIHTYGSVMPADSGWRAVDWMYAAKMMPTPMPGPMAARP